MSNLAQIKRSFFNPSFVGTYLDKKTFAVLNRFGGTVRKTAQYSMRTRKGSSKPGQPPNSHNRKLLRKLLFYSLDKDSKTVVIGPVLKQSSARIGIPNLHEFGGKTTDAKGVTRKYEDRPYMAPAFSKNVGKVASWYKGRKA